MDLLIGVVNDQHFMHNSNYVIDSVHAFISYGQVWVFVNMLYINRRYDDNEKQLFLMVCTFQIGTHDCFAEDW